MTRLNKNNAATGLEMPLKSKFDALQSIYDEELCEQLNITQEDIKMATITDFAKAFEPQKTRNISELKEIPTNLEIVDDEFTIEKDKETGEKKVVKQKVVVLNGEKYRVPISVIADLKAILEKNPGLTKFSVTKKGTGLQTRYTVIPL